MILNHGGTENTELRDESRTMRVFLNLLYFALFVSL